MQAAGARNIQMKGATRALLGGALGRYRTHGNDPKKSVLNQFQQAHDVKKLFLMDASVLLPTPAKIPR